MGWPPAPLQWTAACAARWTGPPRLQAQAQGGSNSERLSLKLAWGHPHSVLCQWTGPPRLQPPVAACAGSVELWCWTPWVLSLNVARRRLQHRRKRHCVPTASCMRQPLQYTTQPINQPSYFAKPTWLPHGAVLQCAQPTRCACFHQCDLTSVRLPGSPTMLCCSAVRSTMRSVSSTSASICVGEITRSKHMSEAVRSS